MSEKKKNLTVSLLPLRDIVFFPHMVAPFFVGRDKSVEAIEQAMSLGQEILLAAQKDAKV
ncbi:MAG: LON peptidase substrate-binding domain-containing protein, partial [Deltaproteobacteria bacterium]|nr:LON peptidase substrate-binding domain-containing protein [Deltaproteobacteria bacterium]